MTTAYQFTDTAPKDAGNQKFWALLDVQTSQLDFCMLKGIGASVPYSGGGWRVGHLGIATHTQGSAIEPLHPFVALGGVYIENPTASPAGSAVSSGSGQIAGMTNWNEVFTRPAPLNTSHVTTSANLIKNGSGIVFGVHIALSGCSQGDVIRLRDSTGDKLTFIAASRFQTYSFPIQAGGIVFDTTIQHAQTTTGTVSEGASVLIEYR